jgi:diaminohydroxyphosphoribosylaminopyrimidine deaminase / 5-amino-6-(5-phosphoribosylamino)uracil reductase
MSSSDESLMARALELAARGRGHVEPNPMVGAVVVRGGQVAGEGWHERYGEAHAEVSALAAAGEASRGATLYVTLEPCCHHGKTPPCADAILRAGISRVVAAMADPFPQVAGRGFELLRQAGIEVALGIGEGAARELNAPYLKLLATGQPYVIAKWAMTLDGRIATRTGDARWVSGYASRHRVHELRGRVDAVLVGIGTALADDPWLTARPPGPRTATRVVLDSHLRLPLASQLVQTARTAPVLVVHGEGVDGAARRALEAAGCECFAVPADDNRLRLPALLAEMGGRRWTNLLIEGGAGILGSFLDAGAIDEVWVFVAPKLIGGAGAKPVMAGRGAAAMAQAIPVRNWSVEPIGDDVLLRGRLSGNF